MNLRMAIRAFFLAMSLISFGANALTASQVFEKVKDSVVVVKTIDVRGTTIGQGSGVLLPSGKVGTNCHVVKNGARFLIGSGSRFVSATRWGGDEDRDICLLEAKDLIAKPAQLGQASRLKVGEPVYAVGAPKGLELSLSDGIVSQLRGRSPPIIQTTAAISPGSSGGGLFDAEGRLVGFTTLYVGGGQNLNFAMPVEWVGEIEAAPKMAQGRIERDWTRQTTLTMSSWVSPTHHLTHTVLQGWANDVEKATSGRVKFQMLSKHPSAPPGTFDAVRDGLVDLSYVTASYTPARHVMPLLPELPGSGNSAEISSVAYSRIHWKHFDRIGEYKGVKLLGVFTHGPGQMFTKKPVANISDLQGLKIRTGGGVAEAVAKALGTSAFVKPAPESYELLNSGVADGVFFPLESIASFKLQTVIRQATLFPGGMYSSAFGFFMNDGKWANLSRVDQDAILKLSGEHIARLAGKSWDKADEAGLAELRKANVKILDADPALVREIQARSAPIIDDWVQKATAKGVDGAKVLAEFREELKKVASGR